MNLTAPYPPELLRVARKVVWYDKPEHTLADLKTFLAHLMVYGSSVDVAVVEQHVPVEEFRKALENGPAGLFTQDIWRRWHERFGMPVPPLRDAGFPMARSVRSVSFDRFSRKRWTRENEIDDPRPNSVAAIRRFKNFSGR
jgi:hypothetical protein